MKGIGSEEKCVYMLGDGEGYRIRKRTKNKGRKAFDAPFVFTILLASF